MWRRRVLLSTFAFLVGLVTATAQDLTLDQIIQKNTEALGGAEAVNSIKTMKLTAKMVVNQALEANMTYFLKRPNQLLTEVVLQGKTITTGYDGQNAWMKNPMAPSTGPQKVDEQTAGIAGSSTMDYLIGSLAGMRAAGSSIELAGQEELDGATAYKLKVSGKADLTATYFVNGTTFLPIKILARVRQMGQELDMETFPSDYRKVGSLLLWHRTENRVGGKQILEMRVENVELNPPLEDSLFRMPQPAEKPKK